MTSGELIIKYYNGLLTPPEEKELEDWLARSEYNRQFFHRLSDPAYIKEKLIRLQASDKQARWEQLFAQISNDGPAQITPRDNFQKTRWAMRARKHSIASSY
jgi:hypothetical protein